MQPPAEPRGLVDDRYRLLAEQGGDADASIWRATDEILDRQVTVRLVPGRTRAQADAIIAAATRAGQVTDARWVRVLDVGTFPADRRRTVWIVTEWVDAPTLADRVRARPLDAPAATALVRDCARAVAAATAAGFAGCAPYPDQILLPAEDRPRILGLDDLPREPDPSSEGLARRDDARRLAAVLVAAQTGRWPLGNWDGLPPVPAVPRAWRPRRRQDSQIRELDTVAAAALAGQIPDVDELAAALARLPVPAPPPQRSTPRGAALRRWGWRLIPPLLVVVIGLVSWVAGKDLGNVPGAARTAAPPTASPAPSGSPASRVVWHRPPAITSFDPEGDGQENPGAVGLAVDADPGTQWSTESYRTAAFGGLKQGVGLLLDLRHPTSVDAAQLLLSARGSTVELHAGNRLPRQVTDLPVVARRTDAPVAFRLPLAHPTKARYWLLWCTTLPRGGTGYRLGVAELALLR